MSLLAIALLGLFLSLFIHNVFFYDYGRAYLSAMYHPGKARDMKDLLSRIVNRIVTSIGNRLGKETIEKLGKVDTEVKEYVKYLFFAPSVGFLIGTIFSAILRLTVWKALGLDFLGAIVGLITIRVALYKEWDNYQNDLKNALPEFVNFLKLSVIAGDTMEEAVRTSVDFIWGPLQKLITQVIRWSDGEMSFTEALERMIAQTDDTDVLAVLQRILNYHSNGITDRQVVFANMAENLTRIINDRTQTDLETMEAKLTLLMTVGMFAGLLRIGIPLGFLAFKQFAGN